MDQLRLLSHDRARGPWIACAASLLLAALGGCTSVAGSSPVTLLRVIDASTNAPALDAYAGTDPIALNFVGPSVSNYAILGPGAATIRLDTQGTHTALAELSGTLLASEEHTIYITDQGTSFQANLLSDQSAAAPAGFVSFRFLQQANATGAVDIYLLPDGAEIADAKPLIASVTPGTNTGYINLPAGTYEIAIAAAGTTKGAYTSSSTAFTSGQARTVLIVDQKLLSSPPVNVLIADDAD